MAAIVHGPDDELPVLLTLDTSWIVAVFNAADSHHEAAWALYQRVLAGDTAVVVCRTLLELEFRSAMRRLARDLKPRQVERMIEEVERRLGRLATLGLRTMDRQDPVAIRKHVIEYGERLLWAGLGSLQPAEVKWTRGLVHGARAWMIRHDLDSLDALHLEVALLVARTSDVEPHMATFDRDFLAVDGLHVWGSPAGSQSAR